MNKLRNAIYSNQLEDVISLVEKGMDINEKINGEPHLSIAIIIGDKHKDNTEIVKYLIDKGADKETLCEGKTALQHAILFDREEIAKYLIDKGADKETLCEGKTALQLAILLHKNEIAKYLIDKGANKEALCEGKTALQLAIFCFRNEIAKYLINNGANKAVLYYKKTLFQYAIFINNHEMAKYLIDQKVVVNVQDNPENTLILSLLDRNEAGHYDPHKKSNNDLLKKLIYNCTDFNLTNKEGISVSKAINKKGEDIIHLISKENTALILYPEMRKDRFARRQIEIALDSNKKIKRNRDEHKI